MTNLSVCEKVALEEVFECLKDEQCRKFFTLNKRFLAYKMMRFFALTRKMLHVRR